MATSNPTQNLEDFLTQTIDQALELKAVFAAIANTDSGTSSSHRTYLANIGAERAAELASSIDGFALTQSN